MDIFKEVSDSAARSLSRTLNDSIAFEKAKKKGEAKELEEIWTMNDGIARFIHIGGPLILKVISMHEIDGQKYIVTEIGILKINI